MHFFAFAINLKEFTEAWGHSFIQTNPCVYLYIHYF